MPRSKKILLMTLALMLLLSGCGGGSGGGGGEPAQAPATQTAATEPEGGGEAAPPAEAEDNGPYEAPAVAKAVFDADKAEGKDGAMIDLSHTSEGYIAIQAQTETSLKMRVSCGETSYDYDVPNDGTTVFYPLQCGNGSYSILIAELVDSNYYELYSTTADVALSDEFQPFLRSNVFCSFSDGSNCAQKAAELAKTSGTALGLVTKVFEYVCQTVTYDTDKASKLQDATFTYVPNPDKTISEGKGICSDYAALVGAMLRSQGIPTKVVFGYVSSDGGTVYHAWNMFYIKEKGWITVKYESSPDTWNRLDLTFSANGADDSFIGNGQNYTDIYYY